MRLIKGDLMPDGTWKPPPDFVDKDEWGAQVWKNNICDNHILNHPHLQTGW